MAGIVTETKRRLLIGKEIKEVQVPTGTLDTSLYLADLASVGATFNSSRIASELGALPAVVKQNASLAFIADTYKTGAVYAMNGDTKSLEELNFERGSSATYEDASGNIVLASANVPRINYRNGVLQGWLVEPASTNLFLDSGIANGLDSFSLKSTEGLTAGASGFNLGSLLANSITLAKGSASVYAYKSNSVEIVAGNVYTFSFFCRLSDGTAPTSNDMRITFGGGSNILLSWNSISYGNGVYRCYVTGVPVFSGATGYFGIHRPPSMSNKTITVSGFQLEEGDLTSYIPTTTAIATRLADKISTKRPTVVFNKNSMNVKTAEWPATWMGNGVDNLNILGKNVFENSAVVPLGLSTNIMSSTSSIIVRSFYYPTSPGEIWSVSRDVASNSRFRIVFTSELPKAGVPFFGGKSDDTALKIEGVVAPEGAKFIFLYLSNNANDTIPKIKLEKSSVSTAYSPNPSEYIKVDANGNIEISYTEPIHIQQLSLISRELSQEEVG